MGFDLAVLAAKYFPGYESDWATRLRGRLYTQFRDALSWQAFSDLIARQAQDLEDSALTLFTLPSIDDSEGVNLDTIGRIVGQQRIGADDATYRIYLKTRVLANRSNGTAEELYKVFRALFGATIGVVVTTSWIGVKAFELRIKTAITHTQALIGIDFLRDSKEAGARGLFEWQEATDANSFYTSGGTDGQGFATALHLTADVAVGAGALPLDAVLAVSYFPANGSIIVDPGMSNQETISYVAYVLLTNVAQNHSAGAIVQVVGDSYGGQLAGSMQA